MKFKLSNHALVEMERRGIPREMLERVLDNPQQVRTLCVFPTRVGMNRACL